ncbi:MAG: FecR family protein [Mariniphaga sp.]|nr:FecR family protein [Mariniphaga sp.]
MKDNKKYNQSISQKADQLIRNYQIVVNSGKEEVLGTLLKKIEEKERTTLIPVRKISWYRIGAASVAAVIAIIVTFWFLTASQTTEVNQGNTYAFRLPDESRVILHNGSSITYSKYFWNRAVKLTGSAYFEVEKGTGFRVKTSNGSVEVLGTRFLVEGMEKDLVVRCYEGSVKTSYEKESWILEPGTQFSGKQGLAQKKNFETVTGFPAFAEFSKSFSNTPVSLVFQEIETFFGVDIKWKTPLDKNFSGSFKTGTLENVLQIVCEPLQLNYIFEDKYRIEIY